MSPVNATPHTVSFIREDGSTETIPPSGICPRVVTGSRPAGTIEISKGFNVPLVEKWVGETVTGLPDPDGETTYIVSQMVTAAAPSRRDLVSPDDVVRDSEGEIIGCRALARAIRRPEIVS
jgi:hypothetical protein